MNILGAIAVAAGILAFGITHNHLRLRPVGVRVLLLGAFALPAMPSLLFAIYYFHILPERAWFYTLRSWTGSEFLAVFLGCAAGAVASLLPRWLLGVPLFGLVVLTTVPYIKPVFWPIPAAQFQDQWQGDVCLQSTPSTCGPASVSTILRRFGDRPSERQAARAAFSYVGGTEAWYLARYVRSRGFVARFEFRDSFSQEPGLPAVVGVRLGSVGHFIAVLAVNGDQVTLADPLRGEETLSLSEFHQRYRFSGFHMVITKG